MRQASIDEVAEALDRRRSRAAVCLVGAGCSMTAGLPSAEEVVEFLRMREAGVYEAAQRLRKGKARAAGAAAGAVAEPGYAELMQCLESRKRYRLFQRWVGVSSLNKAHLALAFLVWRRRIGRVFTTNFDDLVLRACSLYGVYPAVHDLAAMSRLDAAGSDKLFKKTFVVEPAVFYLHGRHNGFEQIHHDGPAAMQAARLDGVIADSRDRLWIVVGYSGESDPLFDTLEQAAGSGRGFYWVNRAPPAEPIRRALARQGAHYVEVPGADEFFSALAEKLSTRKEHWMRLPGAHVERVLGVLEARGERHAATRRVSPGRVARRREGMRLVAQRRRLDHAIAILEGSDAADDSMAVRALAEGLVLRGERLLKTDPSRASADFRRALDVLDPARLIDECHACLLDWDRDASRWQALFAQYRARRSLSGLRDRALLGKARTLVALEADSDAKVRERRLDRMRAELAAVRGQSRRPLLQLALGEVQASRAVAGGASRPLLAREAAEALRRAVAVGIESTTGRKALLARIDRVRRAGSTPRAAAGFAAAVEAIHARLCPDPTPPTLVSRSRRSDH